MPTDMSELFGVTVVEAVALLLDGSTSISVELAVAVTKNKPFVDGITLAVTVAVAPTSSVPRLALIIPPEKTTEPCEANPET